MSISSVIIRLSTPPAVPFLAWPHFWSTRTVLHSKQNIFLKNWLGQIGFRLKQVSVVMWFAPRPPVRESWVRIPLQHGNLVKFILVWVFFNPSGILTQPYPAFLLSASRPFNRWPSVWFGSLSPLTAKWQATSAAEPNLRVTSTQLGWVSNDGNPSHPPSSSLLS